MLKLFNWISGLLVIMICTNFSFAEIIPVKQTGEVVITNFNKNQCYDLAKEQAKRKAVARVFQQYAKSPVQQEAANKLIKNPDKFIRRVTELSCTTDDGRCFVKIRANIDETLIISALEEATANAIIHNDSALLEIGVVIRFLVNNESAEEQKIFGDSQGAIIMLTEELSKLKIHTIDISKFIDNFLKKERKENQSLASLERGEDVKIIKIDSVEAHKLLLEQLRDASEYLDYKKIGNFNLVLAGQVNVQKKGNDPQGGGYVSEVGTYLSLIELNGNAVYAPSHNLKQIVAKTQTLSVKKAMMHGIQASASEIADKLQTYLVDREQHGRDFFVLVKNVQSQRKQLRPLKKALESKGIKVLESTTAENGIKISAKYKGDQPDFVEQVNRALDDLEKVLPDADVKENGPSLTILLSN